MEDIINFVLNLGLRKKKNSSQFSPTDDKLAVEFDVDMSVF